MLKPGITWIPSDFLLSVSDCIDATWFRDSEHPCHLSAVDGNPLVGSTCVRGPATGDSFSLLCIVLLTDVIYSFVMTFNII